MLASDAHGGFGGIAQYNRDVIDALAGFTTVDEVVVLPRAINDQCFAAPTKAHYIVETSTGLLSFISRSLKEGMLGQRYDLIYCAHINLMPVAVAISRMRGLPLALAIYGTDAWQRPSNWLTVKALDYANLVLSISRLTLDRFMSWCPGLKAATAIVPNAIRAERYGLGEKDAVLAKQYGLVGHKVIMTLGRMDPSERAKGFDEIIELMPRLLQSRPDIIYLCAGDGGDRSRLESKAKALGVANGVIFTGRIPEARKPDYFRLADAYIMPSRWEGFGFVVLEALACGIPVVASIVDGTREAVREGELGLLVDPQDPVALEGAILEAVQRPKQVISGLDYFSFANFEKRLHTALFKVVGV
jgi:phosphatidylinositol alpha-1,6-mannosyltransferase